MLLLYNLGIRIYHFLAVLFSLFNTKARLWVKGRKNWHKNILQVIDRNSRTIWIHCSSLGEFEQGRPVIEAIRAKNPEIKILLTFFSPSGYEIRKNYPGADYIFYLPIDTRVNAQLFIDAVNPVAAIFVKYEFWYYYLYQLKKKNVPTYIISAIFRDDQVFFKSYGKWYRNFLSCFTHFFVQNEHSKELLANIGYNNVTVAGDTRFDRVIANAKVSKRLPLLESFASGSRVIIAGSTWPNDEEIIIKYFLKNHEDVKLIIAPHEIHKQEINKMIHRIGVNTIRYTDPEEVNPKEARLMIIDTIGILSSAYQYGTVAYIGGGFGTGIHNTLEAAVFGIPVIFGPRYKKFQEAVDLVSLGIGFSIINNYEFETTANKLLVDINLQNRIKVLASEYFSQKVGATANILNMLKL